ncbi:MULTISPECIES: phage baseplate assembly protein V [Paenibacillus]|uniref:phage baseplate assembly protein V n=1 Tax=Paenibacillus TaxID=44249 RepID=UPI002FE4196B
MNQTIISSADISVSQYPFDRITDLRMVKQVNDHAKLSVTGIVSEEVLDKYVEQVEADEVLQVTVKDKDRTIYLFQGIITNMSVQAIRDVRSITIEAHSSSVGMDIRKESRSFQDEHMTYNQLFRNILKAYPASDLIDEATDGKAIGSLLVQYQETDWGFMRRLASHFHAPLIPVSSTEGTKLYIGVPDFGDPLELQEYNYAIQKDLRDYKVKSENGIDGINEQSSISYSVVSHRWLELGTSVQFHRNKLFVSKVETRLEHDVLTHTYELKSETGLRYPTEYNSALAGTSLFGKITDVAKDKVKLALHMDHGQTEGAMWFPYSTVYSSPDGSGWYCMPEVGDEVRLYFPDKEEKNAFAASSVDVESSDPQKRSDPAVKSISTKYGKQIVFKPGAVEIIGSGQLLMRLTDDGGIEINSDKKISLNAQEDIEIIGGAKIVLQGEAGIELNQANASMKIEDQVTMSGGRVNIE